MRLDARRLPAFLRDPGACRVVLLYGDDLGLIRERADALVRAAADGLDDPFRVVELDRGAAASLPDEAASIPLTGGRRVVRMREVADSALDGVKAVLAGRGEGLVVLEGAALPARSKLRSLLEAASDGAAIGCYPEEGRALEATLRAGLQEAGAVIEPDALAWVAGQLGADRAMTRQAIEKLALLAGPGGGRINIVAAMGCIGDAAALSLDDALFAATEGDLPAADRALELALAADAAPASAARAVLMHLQRLHRAKLLVDGGASTQEAMRAARPPVFWRREASFGRALSLWSAPALMAAMDALSEAERACKRTGAPAETICRNAVTTIARRAAALQRRGA